MGSFTFNLMGSSLVSSKSTFFLRTGDIFSFESLINSNAGSSALTKSKGFSIDAFSVILFNSWDFLVYSLTVVNKLISAWEDYRKNGNFRRDRWRQQKFQESRTFHLSSPFQFFGFQENKKSCNVDFLKIRPYLFWSSHVVFCRREGNRYKCREGS